MRSDRVQRRKTIRKNKKLTNRSKRIKRTRVKRSKKSKKSKKSKLSRKNRRSFIKKSRTNKKASRRNRRMRGGATDGATEGATTKEGGFELAGSRKEIDAQRSKNVARHAHVRQELKNEDVRQFQILAVKKLSEMGITNATLKNKDAIILGLTKQQLEEFIGKMNIDSEPETEVRAFWNRGQDAAAAAAK